MNFIYWMQSFIFFGFLVAGEEIEGVLKQVGPRHYQLCISQTPLATTQRPQPGSLYTRHHP